jgi:hypothetical protein
LIEKPVNLIGTLERIGLLMERKWWAAGKTDTGQTTK